jgi:hypothetical protein
VSSYNTSRHVSTAGFILGGIGVAAGAVLFATAPKGAPRRASGAPSIAPFIGVGSAGVSGSF